MTLTLTARAETAGRADWAATITDIWTTAAEAFIGAGRELIEAKASLPHGDFEAMVKDDLPFGPRTARMLMAVAQDPRIADRNHGSDLPPSWRTLYELSRLDDETFDGALEAGDITAEMGRADVARIRRRSAAGAADDDRKKRVARAATTLDALVGSGERFAVILADPPWAYESYSDKGKARSAEVHYDTMNDEAIAALPVGALAADDCVLFLWATWPKLETALAVLGEWGFAYKTMAFTWVKQNPAGGGLWKGMGFWTRANPEPCILATRGAPKRLDNGVEELIVAPVAEHSRKPADAHERIERLVGGPYVELFARRLRPGWTVWGDEVQGSEDRGQRSEDGGGE